MAEQIVLTTPATIPSKSTTEYHISQLILDVDNKRITIMVRGTNNELITAFRQDTVAMDLIKILNKANNTVKSMERRALEWLQTQPEGAPLVGSITGAPD